MAVSTPLTVDFGTGPLPGVGSVLLKLAPNGTTIWAKRLAANVGSSVLDLGLDPDGNALVVGSLKGAVDLGGGTLGPGGFIAKVDTTGAHVWSHGFGDVVTRVAFDRFGDLHVGGHATGIVDFGGGPMDFTGTPSPRGFVLQRSGMTGAHVASSYAPSVQALTTDDDGDVYVAGLLREVVDLGDGPLADLDEAGTLVPRSIFLMKLARGTHARLWSKGFGKGTGVVGTAHPASLQTSPKGDVLLLSNNTGSVDYGGGVVTTPASPPTTIFESFTPSGAWKAQTVQTGTRWMHIAWTPAGNMVSGGYFNAPSVSVHGVTFTNTGTWDSYIARPGP